MNNQIIRTPFPIPKIEYYPTIIQGVHIGHYIIPQHEGLYNPSGSRRTEEMHNNFPLREIFIPLSAQGHCRLLQHFPGENDDFDGEG